jgi:hypothetical protein
MPRRRRRQRRRRREGGGGCKNYRDPVVRKEARGSMTQLYFTCFFVFLGSIIICQLNKFTLWDKDQITFKLSQVFPMKCKDFWPVRLAEGGPNNKFFYRNTDPLSVAPVLLATLTPTLAQCTSTLRSARTVYSRVHYSRNKRRLFAALTTMHCPVKWWLSVNCEAVSKISFTLDIQLVNSMDPPSKKIHLNAWRRTTLGYNMWQIQFWSH